jgi:Ca2+-binding EF-hand superfamily protein
LDISNVTHHHLSDLIIAVDTDGSGSIDVNELQRALKNGDFQSFSLDTLSILMGMFDVDRSGTIAFNEFASLWR